MNKRPSWEEYALSLAIAAAKRSEDVYCKVGAVALDKENRLLGAAYNGLAPGINVEPEFWKDRERRLPYMIHAEVNLLSLFKRGECKLLATTLLPCACCAQMIAAYQIPRVVYLEEYHRDDRAKAIFDFYGVKYQQITLIS